MRRPTHYARALTPIAVILSIAVAGRTCAATVTDVVTFNAADLAPCDLGCPTPVDPVKGAFTITFDPTQTYVNSTAGISLNSLNIKLDSPLSFDYSPTPSGVVSGATAGELVVGGLALGAEVIDAQPASNDFYLRISAFATSPEFSFLGYSQTTSNPIVAYYYTVPSAGNTVTVTPFTAGSVPPYNPPPYNVPPYNLPSGGPASAAPEPADWLLMLLGVFGIGTSLRGRRPRPLAA